MRLNFTLLAALACATANAQDAWPPSKPLRMVVPYPTGGLTDMHA